MPSFYYSFRVAKLMQEAGFTDCTPANLADYEEYWLQAAMIMHDIENDPTLKKARENMAKRKSARKKTGKGGAKRRTPTGSNLSAVPSPV